MLYNYQTNKSRQPTALLFGEFMHDNNIQFMPIVVTGRIAPSFIYFVKLTIRPRQRITRPIRLFFLFAYEP